MAYNVDFDMSEFVNLDQDFHSPVESSSSSSNTMPRSVSVDTKGTGFSEQQESRQYSAPSHNYTDFRQQTGLPTGVIPNVVAANGYDPLFSSRPLDPSYFGGFDNIGMSDITYEGSSSVPAPLYYPNETNSDDFVDPTAIDAQSQTRAWPGMHSQQAQQVKIEPKAKDQSNKHQPLLMAPAPRQASLESSENKALESQKNDQITRLLNQMRHSSASSGEDDGADNDDSQHMARLRKDEEEMDEDERLLASEQGKKLSSKERRQLRNKVSARAFRSRRKEYISQLEGEVNAKAAECNELRSKLQSLSTENQQLTQLTKLLLSQPAFSSFMNDISNDPQQLNNLIAQSSSSDQTQQKDVPTYSQTTSSNAQQTQQPGETTHVGMSMIPETDLDFSTLNLGGARQNHWNFGNSNFAGFQQPSVYAVHKLPIGPSLEELQSSRLSGKPADDVSFSMSDLAAIADIPDTTERTKCLIPANSEPACLSYVPSKSSEDGQAMDTSSFEDASCFDLHTEQITSSFDLTEAAALKEVDRLFASAAVSYGRIERITNRMS